VVEPREQPRRERVRARGHVDDDVLARAVHEVVEQQLHRAGLGMEAGPAEVGLGERARGQQPHTPRIQPEPRPEPVVLGQRQQPRSRARRRGLDHHVRRRDPWVVAPQVVLELAEMLAERHRDRGVAKAQRVAEMLVDVGVDGQHRPAEVREVTAQQSGQRGLAAATLTDESDLHEGHSESWRRCRAELSDIVTTTIFISPRGLGVSGRRSPNTPHPSPGHVVLGHARTAGPKSRARLPAMGPGGGADGGPEGVRFEPGMADHLPPGAQPAGRLPAPRQPSEELLPLRGE